MALPDIWHFDSRTGILLGPGLAEQSPADLPEVVWLIPAYATDQEPPAIEKDDERAVFVDGAWEVQQIPVITPYDGENEDG